MLKIKNDKTALLKRAEKPFASLQPWQVRTVPPGTTLNITLLQKSSDGHYKVWLEKPLPADSNVDGKPGLGVAFEQWFIWGESWLVLDNSMALSVPYFPQTDNINQPDRTCNTSSCAMLLKYKKPNLTLSGSGNFDDRYWQRVNLEGDSTDHDAQTRALAKLGVQTEWRTNLGYSDLDESLEAGNPVPIGIYHRGTLKNPSGGHIIVVFGSYEDGYICHDPYGSLLDGYTGDVMNGKGVRYSKEILNRRWLTDGDKKGWGRLTLV